MPRCPAWTRGPTPLLVALLAVVIPPAPNEARADLQGPAELDVQVSPAAVEDPDPAKTTMLRVRDVGRAMMSWLTDVMREDPCPEGAADPRVASDEGPKVDWAACPRLSHEDLSRVLVPAYLQELPAADGWGRPLEFCLAVANPCAPASVVGVRSQGADGAWDGEAYSPGAYGLDQLDRDVVWIDGMFVRWPEEPAADEGAVEPAVTR